MHLASFRKGWEGERLADYLLSRVAFTASPASVADDLGSDFFCTFFTTVKATDHTYLQPRLSAAIQVKHTASTTIDLSDKGEYLNLLEIPFLLGIVNTQTGTLSLHSGCYLTMALTQFGIPVPLVAECGPTLSLDSPPDLQRDKPIPFPHVVTLSTKDSAESLDSVRSQLVTHCALASGHVRSRLVHDYLFSFGGWQMVFAGPSSAQTFRLRLLERLTEALYNLEWLERQGAWIDESERSAILSLAKQLMTIAPAPTILTQYLSEHS